MTSLQRFITYSYEMKDKDMPFDVMTTEDIQKRSDPDFRDQKPFKKSLRLQLRQLVSTDGTEYETFSIFMRCEYAQVERLAQGDCDFFQRLYANRMDSSSREDIKARRDFYKDVVEDWGSMSRQDYKPHQFGTRLEARHSRVPDLGKKKLYLLGEDDFD